MKRILIFLIVVASSLTSFGQLISERTDNKITIGFDIFTDFQLVYPEYYNPRTINQGFSSALTYNFPLGNSEKHTVALGLGVTSHNYYSKNRIANPYADTLTFISMKDNENFKRYKINPTYLDIPLELRFRTDNGFKFGVGFKFGILVWAKTKYIGDNVMGQRVYEKYSKINGLEKYVYSTTLRVGYKWISLFAAYQMSRVYEPNTNGPAILPLSVGVTIAPF